MPIEVTNNKPIEYYMIKRKIHDMAIIAGREDESADKNGKPIFVWPVYKFDELVRSGGIIIFPDNNHKTEFMESGGLTNEQRARLFLELTYGKLMIYTLDEYLSEGK